MHCRGIGEEFNKEFPAATTKTPARIKTTRLVDIFYKYVSTNNKSLTNLFFQLPLLEEDLKEVTSCCNQCFMG